jgi:tRNA nucleotidyltransferase (CCA-adding enzyme)
MTELKAMMKIGKELRSVAKTKEDKEDLENYMISLEDMANNIFQDNEHHMQTVNEHIMKCVKIAWEKDSTTFLPLVAYLHDLGKVVDGGYNDYETKEDGMIYAKHFFKHPKLSVEIAEKIFNNIHICNEWRKNILFIIENHENRFDNLKSCRNLLKKADGDFRLLELLVDFQEIDILAQSENVRGEKLEINKHSRELIEELKEVIAKDKEEQASKITLAVNGKDIASKGYKGKNIGIKLKELTEMVKAGEIANIKEDLLNII